MMKAFIGEKVHSRFNQDFNSMEEFEKFKEENKNLSVYYSSPNSSGTVSAQFNVIKKYAIIPSAGERNSLFEKGGKITINGEEYTMVDVGVDGSHYHRPVIWIE